MGQTDTNTAEISNARIKRFSNFESDTAKQGLRGTVNDVEDLKPSAGEHDDFAGFRGKRVQDSD